MPDTNERSFAARVGSDVRRVSGQPFILAYARPSGGVDPTDASCERVHDDVFGDATPAELIRLSVAINSVMHQYGLWPKVRAEMDAIIAGKSSVTVESPVQPAVQRASNLALPATDVGTSAVA